MKTLLFISPEYTLTGAPIYLLHHLQYLKEKTSHNLVIIFRNKSGSSWLLAEFRKVSTVYFWEDEISIFFGRTKFTSSLFKKITGKWPVLVTFFFNLFYLRSLRTKNISLIVSNTATIEWRILHLFKTKTAAHVITIVHEGMKLLAQFNEHSGRITANFKICDSLICVSNQLKSALLSNYISSKQVHVIPGAVKMDHSETTSAYFADTLKISESAKVVLSCGWLSWHKGADLFIQTAIQVLKECPEIHFCWLGSVNEEDSSPLEQFLYDTEKAGISKNVHHIPSTTKPFAFLQRASVFLMLSRDESFSLVTVEACSLKLPVLCFENSGGPCEIINHDPNLVIPYADINLMSKRILQLLDNDEERREIGHKLYERVKTLYSHEKTGSDLKAIFENYMK